MAIDIRMPEISADVETADVLAWLVQPGESVQAGDVLLEIETDKSTVEIESPHTGVLTEILVGDDTTGVAVGTVLARIEPADSASDADQRDDAPGSTQSGEAASDATDDDRRSDTSQAAGDRSQPDAAQAPEDRAEPDAAQAPQDRTEPDAAQAPQDRSQPAAAQAPEDRAEPDAAQAPQDRAEPDTAPAAAPPANAAEGDGPTATALARRIADQAGVPLDQVTGTGARGRITRADVEERLDDASSNGASRAARPAPPSEGERATRPEGARGPAPLAEGSTRVPLSRMRRTIAARLSESKRTIPHFYLDVECRLDALLEARRQLNETLEGGYKISVNDFVVRATALALRLVPNANVSFDEDAMIHHGTVDVAVAVATEGGLITPIVRNADRKGLADISAEVRDLAERARAGKLSPKEYQGGSFSISNLGMYGIDAVYAIVNPPHAGILGVGQGRPTPIVEDGRIVPATVMKCTLSADHRAVDGAVGAEWLATFKRLIESPLEMSL